MRYKDKKKRLKDMLKKREIKEAKQEYYAINFENSMAQCLAQSLKSLNNNRLVPVRLEYKFYE